MSNIYISEVADHDGQVVTVDLAEGGGIGDHVGDMAGALASRTARASYAAKKLPGRTIVRAVISSVFALVFLAFRYVSLGSLLGSAAMFPAMLLIWAVASGAVPPASKPG